MNPLMTLLYLDARNAEIERAVRARHPERPDLRHERVARRRA